MNNEIEARPFEEYKEMIQNMSKAKMIEGLYDLSKDCIQKDKEIERLNKELEEYKKDFKEANDLALKLITNNQEYVCKSIKDTIDILIEKLQQKDDEIKELNNIINTLEKEIENRLMIIPDDICDDEAKEIKRTTKIAVYQVILGKLQELKGDSSNEC